MSVRTPLWSAYLDEAPLQPGDRVRLVSPSGPGSTADVARAVQYLTDWGLQPVVGDHVGAAHPYVSYLAGTDDQRREDLVAAWSDPEAAAVVCLRGGYGAMRLLDGIDWDALRATCLRPDGRPKLLTGSSDITALHQAFISHFDVPTLFCPMPANGVFRDSELIRTDVHKWLFEPWRGRAVSGPDASTLVPGIACGRTAGGNLSLVAASIGAPEHRVPGGEIALIEDVTEDLYRLDNLMVQLQRSGWLAAASGIALGSWNECGDLSEIKRLMREYLEPLGVPVAWELGFGHDPDAPSVPMNVMATLVAEQQGAARLVIGDDIDGKA